MKRKERDRERERETERRKNKACNNKFDNSYITLQKIVRIMCIYKININVYDFT